MLLADLSLRKCPTNHNSINIWYCAAHVTPRHASGGARNMAGRVRGGVETISQSLVNVLLSQQEVCSKRLR